MLNKKIFNDEKNKEFGNMTRKTFDTLLNFDNQNNIVFKVDNLQESSINLKHIFNAEEAVQISSIVSRRENKNVFLINEAFNDDLKNRNTGLLDNFYKLYTGLSKVLNRIKHTMNVIILNMQCPIEHTESKLAKSLLLPSRETANDIAILRNLGNINVFVPADEIENKYLLSVVEKFFNKEGQSSFSYFKISSIESVNIFDENYFIKNDGMIKEWTGMPEIVYFSKNLEAQFEVSIIACGPILYNAIMAAKELEEMNYKVTVLNMSLISSSSEYINEKIKSFINNFASNHKNIITLEEHSKVGGLGSLVAEIIAENRNRLNLRVERMGIEDNLSVRGIIAKCEEAVGY